MIDPARLHGKRLAMIAVGRRPDGGDDVAVFTGVAHWDGERLTLRRETEAASISVEKGWLERIEEVPPALKDALLGAEYRFTVSARDVSGAGEADGLIA